MKTTIKSKGQTHNTDPGGHVCIEAHIGEDDLFRCVVKCHFIQLENRGRKLFTLWKPATKHNVMGLH